MAEEKNSTTEDQKPSAEQAAALTAVSADDRMIKPGVTVRVHQILTEKTSKGEEKKRIQVFEGIVLGRRHRTEVGATITVRKVTSGVGVEKIFPLKSPWISKIEVVKQAKVRRAKLGYLRTYKKKLKEKAIA